MRENKTFILASNNRNKLREMREILSQKGIDLISQSEAGISLDVEENGKTFAENAYIKAKAVFDITKKPAIADDSGLIVDALNGEPGVFSARYAGSHEDSDEDRYSLILKNMQGKKERSARFVASICCILDEDHVITAEGICEGEITQFPRGENGFGYDPIFQVLNTGKTMAEHSSEEKNQISHRARALKRLSEKLGEEYDLNK